MIKVGQSLNIKDDRIYTYKDVAHEEGWVDADEYHPIDYDLVYLKLQGAKDNIRGWCSGNVWDGLKYRGEKVLKWKYVKDG